MSYLYGSGAAAAGSGSVNNNNNSGNRSYAPQTVVVQQPSLYDEYGTYIAIGAGLLFLFLIFKES